jgi:hypothetical protein
VWGLSRSFRASETLQTASGAVRDLVIKGLEDRISNVESAVLRLSAETAAVSSNRSEVHGAVGAREEEPGGKNDLEDYVTKAELADALERAEKCLEVNLEERFRTQSLAIGSLRTMVADTDALLERLLERLESPADPPPDTFDGEELLTRGRAD